MFTAIIVLALSIVCIDWWGVWAFFFQNTISEIDWPSIFVRYIALVGVFAVILFACKDLGYGIMGIVISIAFLVSLIVHGISHGVFDKVDFLSLFLAGFLVSFYFLGIIHNGLIMEKHYQDYLIHLEPIEFLSGRFFNRSVTMGDNMIVRRGEHSIELAVDGFLDPEMTYLFHASKGTEEFELLDRISNQWDLFGWRRTIVSGFTIPREWKNLPEGRQQAKMYFRAQVPQ